MAISFNYFPQFRRASARVVEQVGRKRTQGGAYIPEKVLIVGQYDQDKAAVVEYDTFRGFTAEDFANLGMVRKSTDRPLRLSLLAVIPTTYTQGQGSRRCRVRNGFNRPQRPPEV